MTKQDTSPGAKALGFTMGVLLVGLILVASVAWIALWGGLALSVLWGWFVSPYFNVPELSILHAYGLCLIGYVFRGVKKTNEKESNLDVIKATFLIYPFACAVWLTVGWIVKGMM